MHVETETQKDTETFGNNDVDAPLRSASSPSKHHRFSSFAHSHPKTQVGLLITAELEQALKECVEKVERIAKECRAKNKKFRDIDFDLEKDRDRCQFGVEDVLVTKASHVMRVTEIFENPKFFVDGPDSNDVMQGALGDCWFLSALSTIATSPGLVEKLCVARDEEVGVYGFIFFKDGYRWVNVVVDDQLFWNLPSFEELSKDEKELFKDDKEVYETVARNGKKGLFYARSGASGETWVPLIEKAYAKLHGNYDSLTGGWTSEAIEDLTGGVSFTVIASDILDPDKFWEEELVQSNFKTRLFAVNFPSGFASGTVQGLYAQHTYSILRVKEVNGMRFVVLRNPWGTKEWTGAWADSSKEWFGEWVTVLKELDHVLGDDGEFIMEYNEFLQTWARIEWTMIFDSSWIMSSHWIRVPPRNYSYAWTFGEVFFNFTLPEASTTIVVLSQLDDRYFRQLNPGAYCSLDFVVCKLGESEPKGETYAGTFTTRSVSCQLELEAGEYVVYPRIDRVSYGIEDYVQNTAKWDKRKLSRMLTLRTHGRSIASNYKIGQGKKFLPTPLSDIIESDLKKKSEAEEKEVKKETDVAEDTILTTKTTTTTITTTEVKVVEEKKITRSKPKHRKTREVRPSEMPAGPEEADAEYSSGYNASHDGSDDEDVTKVNTAFVTGENELEYHIFLGLRVYTKKNAVVVITSRLGK